MQKPKRGGNKESEQKHKLNKATLTTINTHMCVCVCVQGARVRARDRGREARV